MLGTTICARQVVVRSERTNGVGQGQEVSSTAFALLLMAISFALMMLMIACMCSLGQFSFGEYGKLTQRNWIYLLLAALIYVAAWYIYVSHSKKPIVSDLFDFHSEQRSVCDIHQLLVSGGDVGRPAGQRCGCHSGGSEVDWHKQP